MKVTDDNKIDLTSKTNERINTLNTEVDIKADIIWNMAPMIHKANQQYYLTELGLMLNYINPELQRHLPPTDTRFRNDLRLYEQGKFRCANFEKLRMIKATN